MPVPGASCSLDTGGYMCAPICLGGLPEKSSLDSPAGKDRPYRNQTPINDYNPGYGTD